MSFNGMLSRQTTIYLQALQEGSSSIHLLLSKGVSAALSEKQFWKKFQVSESFLFWQASVIQLFESLPFLVQFVIVISAFVVEDGGISSSD
jgi:hypothetical protein